MRLDFKRIMSSVLAFVMLFSSLVMVNVVSVSAEDLNYGTYTAKGTTAEWDFSSTGQNKNGAQISASDTVHGITIDPEKKITIYDKCLGIAKTAYIGVPVPKNSEGTVAVLGSTNQEDRFLHLGSNQINMNSSEAQELEFTEADSSTGYLKLIGDTSKEFKIQKMTITLTKGSFSTGSYEWKLVTDKLSGLVSDGFQLEKLSLGSGNSTDTEYNTLVYSDPGYSIVHTQITLKDGLKDDKGVEVVKKEGNTFTVTPTPDMFMKNVTLQHEDISITDGDGRVLHLTCKEHGTTYSILLGQSLEGQPAHAEAMLVSADNEYGSYTKSDEIDIPIHNGKYRVTMGGGTVEMESADTDTDGTPLVAIQEDGSDITGTFKPTEKMNISKAVNGIKFTNLLTTADARAERLMGGTVVGDTETDKGYLRVIGEGYLNVYALSGTASEHGTNAKAIVIRAAAEGEEGASGAIKGGGLGFTIANKDTVGSKTFNVTVHAEAVKDKNTEGTESDLGLAKINTDGIGAETVGTDITSMKITKVGDTDKIDENNAEAITFTTPLEAGESYVLYNKGNAETQGNIRIYSIDFTEASGEAPGTVVFADKLNPADYTADSEKNFADEYIDTENKFHVGVGSTKVTVRSIDFSGSVDLDDGNTLNNQANKINTLNFGGSGSKTKDHISFTTTEPNGKIYVYGKSSNTNRKIKFDSDSGASDERNFTQTAKAETFVFDAKDAGTYYIYSSANSFDILFIGSTVPLKGAEIPKQNITVKATNNTAEQVTVTLKDGITFDVTGNATPDSPIPVSDVPEGTYTLSVPSGYKVTPSQITVSEESKEFEITISESNEATVKFTVDSGTAKSNIAITKPDGSKIDNFKTGTESATAEAGEIFKIDVASASSLTDVYGWEASVDGGGDAGKFTLYNHREQKSSGSGYDYTTYINYILPQDAKGKTYTVTFKRKTDAYKDLNTEDQKSGALTGITYGQYGFGEDKINVCGSNARDVVNYAFALPTLCDYSSSYSDSKYLDSIDPAADYVTHFNQYGIINEEAEGSYAEFKIADKGELNLDEAVNTVKVSIDFSGKIKITSTDDTGFSKNLDSTGTFDAKPGCTYKIEDNNAGSKPTYLKSIRLLNNNNVFATDTAAGRTTAKLSTYNDFNSKAEAAGATITTAKDITGDEVQPTDTVFGVITQITLQHKDALYPSKALDDIEAIGYDVYTKADYDKAENALPEGAQYHFNANQTLQDGQEKPEPKEIKFTDTVNTAVDISIDGLTEEKVGTLNPDDKTAGSGKNLFVHTYFAVSADKPIVLVPFTIYKSDTSTKVYTNVAKSADNNIIITLDPSAE